MSDAPVDLAPRLANTGSHSRRAATRKWARVAGTGGNGKPGGQRPLVDTPKGSGRRLRGVLLDYLGERIVTGQVAPGETLPGEVETAEKLDISRGAYREAVKMLAAKGLVESRPKTGTRVLERARWNLLDPEVMRWAFAGRPDAGLVRDLFEMRAAVEPSVARLAAKRRSDAQVERMRQALATMSEAGLTHEIGRDADRMFHETLLAATGNQVMMTLSASISAAVAYTTIFKSRAGGFRRDPIPDHLRVFDAVEAQDEDAAAGAMRELLDLAYDDTQHALTDHAAKA